MQIFIPLLAFLCLIGHQVFLKDNAKVVKSEKNKTKQNKKQPSETLMMFD